MQPHLFFIAVLQPDFSKSPSLFYTFVIIEIIWGFEKVLYNCDSCIYYTNHRLIIQGYVNTI
jgi:hypothetical protein